MLNGEPCRTNYSATKKHPFEGGTGYGFPSDLSERELWEKRLPNRLSDEVKYILMVIHLLRKISKLLSEIFSVRNFFCPKFFLSEIFSVRNFFCPKFFLSEIFSVRNFFHGAQNLNLKHRIQSFVDRLVDKFRTSLKNVVR